MDRETAILPLVVDLDGTLLKTNPIGENVFDGFRHDPLSIWNVPIKVAFGRAKVKAFVAAKSLESDTWPVQGNFLEYAKTQFELGRKIVLATRADKRIADVIAAHYPFISEVIVSDGASNLKGQTKAKCLRERFPEGFIYAGDTAADLTVS